MARMIKRKCCLCGKEYETYCPSCREAAYQPSYLNSFHSENCAKVYEACAGYSGHALSKEEAGILLRMCDLSDRVNYTPATQQLLDEILVDEAKAVAQTVDASTETKDKEVEIKKEVKKTSYNKSRKIKRK